MEDARRPGTGESLARTNDDYVLDDDSSSSLTSVTAADEGDMADEETRYENALRRHNEVVARFKGFLSVHIFGSLISRVTL